jgi:uncharacterized protein YegL
LIALSNPSDDYINAFKEFQGLENNKKVVTYPFGVEGYNEGLLKQMMLWYDAEIEGVVQKKSAYFQT